MFTIRLLEPYWYSCEVEHLRDTRIGRMRPKNVQHRQSTVRFGPDPIEDLLQPFNEAVQLQGEPLDMSSERNGDAGHGRETPESIEGMSNADDKEVTDLVPPLVVRRTPPESLNGVLSLGSELFLKLLVQEPDTNDAAVGGLPIPSAQRTPQDFARTVAPRLDRDTVDMERISSELLGPA